ncbi:hypothetical protein EYF80_026851 [Liparis tanakae]|uniref:Uncharacterized protein n=1 Tax=Liparis tanakae TaxID=230148 RepID=A0A4Z2HAQ9_9TELE|nr:hypothetical protein EYF80_026851 [Liparis tanakae]
MDFHCGSPGGFSSEAELFDFSPAIDYVSFCDVPTGGRGLRDTRAAVYHSRTASNRGHGSPARCRVMNLRPFKASFGRHWPLPQKSVDPPHRHSVSEGVPLRFV